MGDDFIRYEVQCTNREAFKDAERHVGVAAVAIKGTQARTRDALTVKHDNRNAG